MKRRLAAAAALLALLPVLLSGCLMKSVDDLYALPRRSEAFYDLQEALDVLMADGAQYSAPASGDNQQAVQLADLTGDGENEIIVFLKYGQEKPLKVYIYQQEDDGYDNIAVLEADGSAFDRVEYCQLDGAAGQEIVIGTKISDQVPQSLVVYTLHGGGAAQLLTENYSSYLTADLDDDGKAELVTLNGGAEGANGHAALYRYFDGALQSAGQVTLSAPIAADTLKRITAAKMTRSETAVFVTTLVDENWMTTDVLVLASDGSLLSVLGDQGERTMQGIYGVDIDHDGVMELPSMQRLQSISSADEQQYYLVNWYNLQLDGQKIRNKTTFYNSEDNWYLTIPDDWDCSFCAQYSEDESGLAGYTFYGYRTVPDEAVRLFTIYMFSGTNAQQRAEEDGRFVLTAKGDVVYAAAIWEENGPVTVSEERLTELFSLIQIQWNSGLM